LGQHTSRINHHHGEEKDGTAKNKGAFSICNSKLIMQIPGKRAPSVDASQNHLHDHCSCTYNPFPHPLLPLLLKGCRNAFPGWVRYTLQRPCCSTSTNPASIRLLPMPCTERSVIPTLTAISRSFNCGLSAMHNSTWAWLVRNVHFSLRMVIPLRICSFVLQQYRGFVYM